MSTERSECRGCGARDVGEDGRAARFLSLPAEMSVRRCGACGLRWLSPMLSIGEYQDLYRCHYFEEIPEDYGAVVSGRIEGYRDRLRAIRRMLGSGEHRLLDVGAATGDFVKEAAEAGFEASGLEPSDRARADARARHGLNLQGGDLLSAGLEEGAYDIVHMNHVLEHLVDPTTSLGRVCEILRVGGLLVLEVPYQFDNLAQRVSWALAGMRPIEFSIYSVHHPFFYDPSSLRRVLQRAGLEIRRQRVWRPHMRRTLREARRFCKVPGLRSLEQWVRLAHILALHRGDNVALEVVACKPRS